jgi:hypothetical protein
MDSRNFHAFGYTIIAKKREKVQPFSQKRCFRGIDVLYWIYLPEKERRFSHGKQNFHQTHRYGGKAGLLHLLHRQ